MSCKNGEKSTSRLSVDEIAIAQLGKNYERKDNGTLSLCYSVDRAGNKRKNVVVIDTENGALLFGPQKLNADVGWFSEKRLIIKEYPEVIKDQTSTNNFTYYYDLVAKKRITATEEK